MASAIGGIIGGGLQAGASAYAAKTQSDATKYAADQGYRAAQDSTDFQKQVYGNTQANLSPYLDTGAEAQYKTAWMANHPELATDTLGQFQAPTGVTEQNDPGFQFRLQQGQQALERSAAARGGAMGGGALKSINDYAQGQASNEYGNVYNRALQGYQTNYNNLTNDYQRSFGQMQTVAGAGQNAAVGLGSAGNQAGSNIAYANASAGNQAGNYATQGANANAAGAMGIASGIGSAVNSVSSYFQNKPKSSGNTSSYASIMDPNNF